MVTSGLLIYRYVKIKQIDTSVLPAYKYDIWLPLVSLKITHEVNPGGPMWKYCIGLPLYK